MTGRTWRWLRTRIEGLLTRPFGYAPNGDPVFAGRLQEHVFQPAVDNVRAAADGPS